jgi:hypothetical protein
MPLVHLTVNYTTTYDSVVRHCRRYDTTNPVAAAQERAHQCAGKKALYSRRRIKFCAAEGVSTRENAKWVIFTSQNFTKRVGRKLFACTCEVSARQFVQVNLEKWGHEGSWDEQRKPFAFYEMSWNQPAL